MILKCSKCRNEFLTYPCRIKTGEGKYCSSKCYHESGVSLEARKKISRSTLGRKPINYQGIERTCLICSNRFITHRSCIKKGHAKYCSHKCKCMAQKGFIPWNKGQCIVLRKACLNCGKEFEWEARPSRIKEGWGKFCSRSCTSKFYINKKGLKTFCFTPEFTPWNKGKKCPQLSGENSPFWRGGITPEIKKIRNCLEMQQWRESVFKRDNYTCRKCGKRGTYLEADHIKPFCLFPDLRFELNNGRTLCHKCHTLTPTYTVKAKQMKNMI